LLLSAVTHRGTMSASFPSHPTQQQSMSNPLMMSCLLSYNRRITYMRITAP
jgi:hypothetical protein